MAVVSTRHRISQIPKEYIVLSRAVLHESAVQSPIYFGMVQYHPREAALYLLTANIVSHVDHARKDTKGKNLLGCFCTVVLYLSKNKLALGGQTTSLWTSSPPLPTGG